MYTLTLSDGTKFEGLTLKDNCLVSKAEITASQLLGRLSPVNITGTKGSEDEEDTLNLAGSHQHMQLAYIRHKQDGYYIGLSDIEPGVYEMETLKANVEYLAMMSGVEL